RFVQKSFGRFATTSMVADFISWIHPFLRPMLAKARVRCLKHLTSIKPLILLKAASSTEKRAPWRLEKFIVLDPRSARRNQKPADILLSFGWSNLKWLLWILQVTWILPKILWSTWFS